MKNKNYITLLGWMFNVLELNGNNALVFALVYGFSQDGESRFNGSLNYIANTLNISKNTVIKSLKYLESKGYIIKEQTTVNSVTYNQYYTCSAETALGSAKIAQGSAKTGAKGSAETAPNINSNNNTNNIYITALDFLEQNHIMVYQDLVAKYKSQIKDWNYFVNQFNAAFETDNLEFTARIIRGRFLKYANTWIYNTDKNKQPNEPAVISGPQFQKIS